MLNADAIVVKLNSGDYKTIHLSSIRPPRLEGENTQVRIRKQWTLFPKTKGKELKKELQNREHMCDNTAGEVF